MIDATAYDRWLTTQPDAEPFFEQYAAECDTPQNRANLARHMADGATSTFTLHLGSASLKLDAAILRWLDEQESTFVLGWMADEGIVPTYEKWAEPDPPCEPEDHTPLFEDDP